MNLSKMIKTPLIGASVGAAAGVGVVLVKMLQNGKNKQKTDSAHTDQSERIINLKYAPDAEEVVNRMADYRPLDPEAYKAIRLNMDRLVGLYLLTHTKQPVPASYEIKASRYRFNIQEALRRLAGKYGGNPSKQFGDDTDMLLKCADNYLYNLSQQMREKYAAGEVTVG